ncbi:DUF2207 domain-containing protein [Candidatus Saccharibacteria bacterium]|nr:DUF2207 domain-containing protein [Candidatus Saccharibacteria bacterium]
MKRFILGLITVALIAVLNINPTHADVNDFTITDFQADYYLDKDNNGHSTLRTIEKITAQFPEYDQNHGIERVLIANYDNHTTKLNVESVTDQNDSSLNYSTYWSNSNLILRIGDSETYVHGARTYVIKYSQTDVTRYFANTNDDEFYWDVNGTGWSQKFDNITARLHLGSGIISQVNNKNACYYGQFESNSQCAITKFGDVITASVTNLGMGDNMTIVAGFNPHTFTEYKMTVADFLAKYSFVISAIIGSILLIILTSLKITRGRGAKGRGTIVPEYLPPKGINVALSSVINGKEATWAAATYIDLAVRHNLRIIEVEKKLFSRAKYSLEFVNDKGLDETEKLIITTLFGDDPIQGAKYEINPSGFDYKVSRLLKKAYKNVKADAQQSGYYIIDKQLQNIMIGLVVVMAIQAFVMWMLSASSEFGVFNIIIGVLMTTAGSWIIISTKPLSVKGRELFDYLKGLQMYIKYAEADRIKVLQSPQGAEKTPVDTSDVEMLVHLYERVLPYAVLFGIEKEWTKVLGRYYEQQNTAPSWYIGHSVFNAAAFSSSMSNFSGSATTSSYSASSGGSGGGGFSGGGGGGGGGGGW